MSEKETVDEKIRRVATEIQEILVREHMAMIPTISIQEVPQESSIIVPN